MESRRIRKIYIKVNNDHAFSCTVGQTISGNKIETIESNEESKAIEIWIKENDTLQLWKDWDVSLVVGREYYTD